MDNEFEFKDVNNRVRLVGKIALPPKPYEHGKYRFYVDARINPDKPNLVPVICGPKYLDRFVDEFKVGDRVVLFGSLNATAYLKQDNNSKEMKIFEEFVRLQRMLHTDKEYNISNIAIFKGLLVKKPEVHKDRYGNERYFGVLKIPGKYVSVTAGLSFTLPQLEKLENVNVGDEIGVKCRFLTTEHLYRKTRVQPIFVFSKEDNLEDNPAINNFDVKPTDFYR